MDWFSRRVLSRWVSITMDTDFCDEALREATELYGRPEIFHTDQGVRFISAAVVDELASRGVRISMDGNGRYLDNIFIICYEIYPLPRWRLSSLLPPLA